MTTKNMLRNFVTIICFILLFFPLNSVASDGLVYTSPAVPGFVFVTVEGDEIGGMNSLLVVALDPTGSAWEAFFGPEVFSPDPGGDVFAIGSVTGRSDLTGQWTVIEGTLAEPETAQLIVESCTTNCLFTPGETVNFTRVFGGGGSGELDDGSGEF